MKKIHPNIKTIKTIWGTINIMVYPELEALKIKLLPIPKTLKQKWLKAMKKK